MFCDVNVTSGLCDAHTDLSSSSVVIYSDHSHQSTSLATVVAYAGLVPTLQSQRQSCNYRKYTSHLPWRWPPSLSRKHKQQCVFQGCFIVSILGKLLYQQWTKGISFFTNLGDKLQEVTHGFLGGDIFHLGFLFTLFYYLLSSPV